MTDYTKTTNFASKDSLPSGNANKIVKGAEIDTEFNNIATASATKANIAGPTFTGTVTIPTADINGGAVDATTIGASSASSIVGTTIVANTSINIAGDGATVTGIKDEDDMSSNSATKLATQQSIKAYVDSQVTAQDLDVTDGSSSIDIDLDSESLGILGGTGLSSTASGTSVTLAIDSTVATLTGSQTLTNKTLTAPTLTGTAVVASLDISGDVDVDGTLETDALSINGTTVTSTAAELNILDGVTSTAAELNILDGKAFLDEDNMASNSATGIASQQSIKAYVDSQVTAQDLDVTDGSASIDIDLDSESLGILGGTGIDSAASGTGVTLSIDSTVATLTGTQTLTNKTLTAPTLTGTAVVASLDISGDVDVDGTLETDALSINSTTVTSTAAELNILDGVTATTAELNYVDGVTSAIQTQIDAKAPIANPTFTGSFTSPGIDDNADAIAITIDSSENVGIGTSGPLDKLDVAGNLRISDGALVFDKPTVYGFRFLHNDAGNDLSIQQGDVNNANYVTRLNIGSSGNVGIGTSTTTGNSGHSNIFLGGTANIYADSAATADASLSISQNAFVDSDGSWEYRVTDEATNYYQNAGNHVWRVAASGTAGTDISWQESMRIDSSGNVGIGTNSPNTGLSVVTGSANGIELGQDSDASTDSARLFFSTSAGSNAIHSSSGAMRFFTGSTAGSSTGTEAMRIDSSGNVLVGTSDAVNTASNLHDGVTIYSDGRTDISRSGGQPINLRRRGSDGTLASFYKEASGAITNVGLIGTNGGTFYISAPSSSGAAIVLNQNANIVYPGQNSSGTVSVTDNAIDLGASAVRFKDLHMSGIGFFGLYGTGVNSGNVAVGEGVYVGAISSANQLRSSSEGGSSSTLYIGNAAIQVSSDQRLKTNIVDTEMDALEKVNQVRIVDFNWDDPSDTSFNNRNARGKWTGVLAQELVDIFPFAVNAPRNESDLSIDTDSEQRWLVDQAQMVPVLIKAIQEQQDLIEALTARITALEG